MLGLTRPGLKPTIYRTRGDPLTITPPMRLKQTIYIYKNICSREHVIFTSICTHCMQFSNISENEINIEI
jgi:hypothetical protein